LKRKASGNDRQAGDAALVRAVVVDQQIVKLVVALGHRLAAVWRLASDRLLDHLPAALLAGPLLCRQPLAGALCDRLPLLLRPHDKAVVAFVAQSNKRHRLAGS